MPWSESTSAALGVHFGNSEMAGVVFFTFACVFFLVLAMLDIARRRYSIKRRTAIDLNSGAALFEANQRKTRMLSHQSVASTSALLGGVERRSKDDGTEASKIQRDLVRAGFFGPRTVLWYQAIRVFLFLTFGLTCLLVISRLAPGLQASAVMGGVAACAGIGFILPSQYLRRRRAQIVLQCRDGFPDFIDLFVICSEGGLSPRASIDMISREIAQTHPYLGANLHLTNLEVRAGASLHEALFNLGRRTEVEEATVLATLLEQTEVLGTSITETLRVYSDEMRDRRLMRAEEKAHALPVKLVLPLGLYIFPVILIVILLPVVLRMKHALM